MSHEGYEAFVNGPSHRVTPTPRGCESLPLKVRSRFHYYCKDEECDIATFIHEIWKLQHEVSDLKRQLAESKE